MRLSRSLLLALAVLVVAQGVYFYPRMPPVMASHFDGSGAPDGYESKVAFFSLVGVIFLLTGGAFAGMGPLLGSIPARWWNLPRRDYWLAPEREAETRGFVAVQMEWFGAATMVLLLLSMQMVYEANLDRNPRLDASSLGWLLGGYTLLTLLWLFRFIRHFRGPDRAEPT